MNYTVADKPLAARGFLSFRYKTPYGWCMIGAKNKEDALHQASRSTPNPKMEDLQVWDGREYIPVSCACTFDEASKGGDNS